MAGQRATIDKDTSGYRSQTSAPESQRMTAYHDQKGLEGTKISADRNGNDDTAYRGTSKPRQGRRPADQSAIGTTGIGDTGAGLERAESTSPFRKVLQDRFGLSEAENPGVASSPSTSDNPSLGMYNINNTDFRQQKVNVKNILEGIALQAAETFEALDENKNIPEALSSELDQCSKVIDKLYSYITSSDLDVPGSGSTPMEKDPPTMPVRREGVEMKESKAPGETYDTTTHSPTAVKPKKFRIKAETWNGEKFISEKMTKKACKQAMQEMFASGVYLSLEMIKGNPAETTQQPDESEVMAKVKMMEAASYVALRILNRE